MFTQKLWRMARSRRFLIVVAEVITIACGDLLGLDETQIKQLLTVGIAIIAADSWRPM